MNRFTLKTTLCRSNPHVIREFAVNGDCTVFLLLQVVSLLHGWERNTSLKLYADGMEIQPQTILDTFLSEAAPADEWHIRIPMAARKVADFQKESLEQQEQWDFRLEILKVEDVDDPSNPPVLIRFRGKHPLQDCTSMYQCNRSLLSMAGKEHMYYGWGYQNAEACEVNPAKLNRRLSNLTKETEEYQVRKGFGSPLRTLLGAYRVDDLRAMLSDAHLNLSYQGKKAVMIERIAQAMDNPTFWNRVLHEMEQPEYLAFKQLCSAEPEILPETEEEFPVLGKYLLCGFTPWDDIVLPSELVRYYGQMMEEEGDVLLLREKRFTGAMLVALRLYCVFPVAVLHNVYEVLYPECRDFEDVWKEESRQKQKNGINWDVIGDNLIYHTGQMNRQTAWNLKESRIYPGQYYIPDQDEALSILKNGLQFSFDTSKRLHKALEQSLRFSYWINSSLIPKTVDSIYQQFHLGYSSEEIFDSLEADRYNFTFDNPKNFLKVLNSCRPEVRRAALCGYTEKEQRNSVLEKAKNSIKEQAKEAVRKARVYPNDPCPCGSGLKYKHCHGKFSNS